MKDTTSGRQHADAATEADRRQEVRVDANLAVEYRVLPYDRFRQAPPRRRAKTSNVSSCGMLVPLPEIIDDGSYLELILHVGRDEVQLTGRTVHVDREPGAESYITGITFLNMTPADAEKLRGYLVEL